MKPPRSSTPPENPVYPVKVERIPGDRQAWWRIVGQRPVFPEVELLAHWMDNAFQIPGLRWRFGLDALLGLLPGFGDTATSIISLYILHTASRRGVSRLTMTRMATNIAIDYVVGAIPFVGDVFDVYWKANLKNVELLRRETLAGPTARRRLRLGDWFFFLSLATMLVTLLVGSVTITWLALGWMASRIWAAG